MRISSQGEPAYRQLAEMIRAGALLAGDALPAERQLCRIFGIARGSLRGSLDMLDRDGVIRICHGKPTLVTNLPLTCWTPVNAAGTVWVPGQVMDVISAARQPVDNRVVARPPCRINDDRVARLRALAEMQRTASDLPPFLIVDRQFHTELATCCDDQQLASLLQLAGPLMRRALRDAFASEHARQDAVTCHLFLVQTLERRDVGGAVSALCDQFEKRAAICLSQRAPA